MLAMLLTRLSAVLRAVSVYAALLVSSFALSQASTTVLVDVDHRQAMSLNGDWHFIADPYRNGWGDNPEKANPKGFARNWHIQSPSELVEYDFSKSPTLHVPGDWNSQRPELFLYEGLLWYEKDFEYHARKGTHVF